VEKTTGKSFQGSGAKSRLLKRWPAEIIAKTSAKYLEAYEKLTGKKL